MQKFNSFIELTYRIDESPQILPLIFYIVSVAAVGALLIFCFVKCFKYRKANRPLDILSTTIKLLVLIITRIIFDKGSSHEWLILGLCAVASIVVVVWDVKTYKVRYGLMFAWVHIVIGNILGFIGKYVLAIVVIAFVAYFVYERFISDKKSFSMTEFVNKLKSL